MNTKKKVKEELYFFMNYYSVKNAYIGSIEHLLKFGETTTGEDGEDTIELLNLEVVVDFEKYPYTDHDEKVNGIIWNGTILENYCNQLLDPTNKGFVHDYGNRLRGYVDQLQYVINKLKSNSTSRRALMITWRPKLDTQHDSVPCMILLQFIIRDNALYITGYWRSWDIYGASYANMKAIENIARKIQDELEVELAELTIYTASAHIYKKDLDEAKRIVKENSR